MINDMQGYYTFGTRPLPKVRSERRYSSKVREASLSLRIRQVVVVDQIGPHQCRRVVAPIPVAGTKRSRLEETMDFDAHSMQMICKDCDSENLIQVCPCLASDALRSIRFQMMRVNQIREDWQKTLTLMMDFATRKRYSRRIGRISLLSLGRWRTWK